MVDSSNILDNYWDCTTVATMNTQAEVKTTTKRRIAI